MDEKQDNFDCVEFENGEMQQEQVLTLMTEDGKIGRAHV